MLQIEKIRKTKGLTQEALSMASGVPRAHLSVIENGKASPTLATLEKIAKALGVQTVELIGDI